MEPTPSTSSVPSASTPSTASAQSPMTSNAPAPSLQPQYHQTQQAQPHPPSYPVTSPTAVTSPHISAVAVSSAPETPTGSSQSPTPRLRSSIACARCRRSKIKCSNAGAGTTCEACAHSGRECVYPVPGTGGVSAVAAAGPVKREGESEEVVMERFKRPRVRKGESDKGGGITGVSNEAHGRERDKDVGMIGKGFSKSFPAVPSPGKELLAGETLLDPTVLTEKVLNEVFELFQLHFGTDLPFLHAPTFLPLLHNAAATIVGKPYGTTQDRFRSSTADKMPSYEILLLGILSLTAKFHPRLVATHCPSAAGGGKDKDAIHASEVYASALHNLLISEKGVYNAQPNLLKIQALLMLGLHEWESCKGIKAWIHVGTAIRMAQAIGLQFEDDLEADPAALLSSVSSEADHRGGGEKLSREPRDPLSTEACVDEETKRRTFWSCFIMDRYLSNGKYRPSMLALDDMKLQLPCSENAWVSGERVCTGLISGGCSGMAARARMKSKLYKRWKEGRPDKFVVTDLNRDEGNDGDGHVRCEWGSEEGLLSRFVRIVEIWGRIAEWSCAGGRRGEEHSPWNPQSKFYQLREALTRFHDSTPRPFRLTKANIQAHLTQHTSPPFALLHTLYSLCILILHRENIPFVPILCSSPERPFDETMLPSDSSVSPNFWADSARQVFKAARDIVDLMQACQSRGLLVETPVVGFGLYNAAFVGVYAMNFPHMDSYGYMCGKSGDLNDAGHKAALEALEMVGRMRPRLPMATSWFRTIHRVYRHYEKIISDYNGNNRMLSESSSLNSSIPQRHLNLKEGSYGQGGEGFRLLEKTLKELGTIEDEGFEPNIGGDRRLGNLPEFPLAAEQSRPIVESRPAESWTAINSIVNADERPSMPHGLPSPVQQYPSVQHRYQDDRQSLRPSSTNHPPYPRSPSSASMYPANDQRPPFSNSPGSQSLNYHQPSSPQHKQSPLTYQPHYPHYPPPTRLESLLNAPNSAKQNLQTQPRPSWLSSLHKLLRGDDVAAFLDGRSYEEWAAAADRRFGDCPYGQGAVMDSWLWDVWGQSSRSRSSGVSA